MKEMMIAVIATGYRDQGVQKVKSMPKPHIKENEVLVKVIITSVYRVISTFRGFVHNLINQYGLTFESRTSDFPKYVEHHIVVH